MLNWRKVLVSGVLVSSLTFSGLSASAVSFDDVSGSESEASISKLVSLGIIINKGSAFNPEDALTRIELANISSRIMDLQVSSSFKIKDVNTTKGKNKVVNRAIKSGIFKVNKNNEFKPYDATTYADLSKALAYGLGFKSHWSDRPIDYFFFLERKGILDIDTDLDAEVTREAAAVAIDKYMLAKQNYDAGSGVVAGLTDSGVLLKSDTGVEEVKLASNVSIFLDGQAGEKGNLAKGTVTEYVLNSKGEIAYVSGSGLEVFDGKLSYNGADLTHNGAAKKFNLNAVITNLPNNPEEPFTFTEFSNYASKAGVTFDGTLYTSTLTDEVSLIESFISKVTAKPITLTADAVTVDFSGNALKNQTFKFGEEVKFSLVAGDKTTEVKLEDLTKLQTAGKVLTGTLEAIADGTVTTLSVTAADPVKK